MPRTLGRSEELRDEGEHVVGEFHVLGFLGIDAEPGEMRQAELGGAFGFVLGELAEVVAKAGGGTAVEARPEGRFANGLAAGHGQREVIVRDAADHVGVGFDEAHQGVEGKGVDGGGVDG